jgi:hypothetical protein
MRRAGLIVTLYAFMISYYGVGSLKNSLGSAPIAGAGSALALAFGLCWIGLFLGGVLLVLRKNAGRAVAQTAAGASALLQIADIILFWRSEGFDLPGFLFTFSPLVYALFLAWALPRLSGEEGAPSNTRRSLAVVASGALLPWFAALGVKLFTTAVIVPPQGISLFIAAFMSLWCAIPFGVLALTVDAWPGGRQRSAVLAGGIAGLCIGSLYCYGLIWAQTLNSFILALLPPVVFAAEALGIGMGILVSAAIRGQDRA